MTDHARYRSLLEALPEFVLEPDEQADLDDHLGTCDECRTYGLELAAAMRAVAALPPIEAPARVRRGLGVGESERATRSSGRFPRWARAVAGIAVAAAPLTIAVVLLSGARISIGPFIFGGAGAGTPAPAAFSWTSPEIGRLAEGTSAPGGTAAPLLEPPITALRGAATGKSGSVAVGEACPVPEGDAGCEAAVIVSTDGGLTWRRVVGESSLVVRPVSIGIAGGMRAIAATSGGSFVAVGATGGVGGPRAAAWTSSDGRHWEPVDDSSFEGAWMNSIAALEDRLVAVGGRLDGGRIVGASWVSIDGTTWTAGPTSDALGAAGGATAGSPDTGYLDVAVSTGPGWVAIGRACSDGGECRGIVRTSTDGLAWIESGGSDPFGGGIPVAVGTRDRLLAVGSRDGRASAWFSDDATTWSGSTIDVALPPTVLTALDGESGRWLAAGIGPGGEVVLLQADELFPDDVIWGATAGPVDAPGGNIYAVVSSGDRLLAVIVGVDAGGRPLLLVGSGNVP